MNQKSETRPSGLAPPARAQLYFLSFRFGAHDELRFLLEFQQIFNADLGHVMNRNSETRLIAAI